MSNNWDGEGYDAEVSTGGGLYLRLKNKGQKARIRLVSACYRFTDTIIDNGKPKDLKKAAWIAIHKEIVDGKPTKRVVVFQAGPMVYGAIKDFDESSDWGDPTLYDIEVTRTEEAGKYYTVVPLPRPMGPLPDDEKALVAEANINLREACKPKQSGNSDTSYDPTKDPASLDHDPFADA